VRSDGSKSFYDTLCRISGVLVAVSIYLSLTKKTIFDPFAWAILILGSCPFFFILWKKSRINDKAEEFVVLYRSVGHISLGSGPFIG
jgi:hypothetical protein